LEKAYSAGFDIVLTNWHIYNIISITFQLANIFAKLVFHKTFFVSYKSLINGGPKDKKLNPDMF
jgi:hypothetical protein